MYKNSGEVNEHLIGYRAGPKYNRSFTGPDVTMKFSNVRSIIFQVCQAQQVKIKFSSLKYFF